MQYRLVTLTAVAVAFALVACGQNSDKAAREAKKAADAMKVKK